ncbi:unnamed protein product [Sphagnum tenellum]
MLHITPMQRRLLDLSERKNDDNLQKRAAAIYVHPVLAPVAKTGSRSPDDLALQGDVKRVVKEFLLWELLEWSYWRFPGIRLLLGRQ